MPLPRFAHPSSLQIEAYKPIASPRTLGTSRKAGSRARHGAGPIATAGGGARCVLRHIPVTQVWLEPAAANRSRTTRKPGRCNARNIVLVKPPQTRTVPALVGTDAYLSDYLSSWDLPFARCALSSHTVSISCCLDSAVWRGSRVNKRRHRAAPPRPAARS